MTFQSLASNGPMQIVFPSKMPGIAAALSLMKAERAEFEAVFGVDVVFVEDDPGFGPRWLIVIDSERSENVLMWDRDALTLTSHAKNASGWMTTLNLLHLLAGLEGDSITDAPESTTTAAVERVYQEIAGTFPGFGIRGKDWDEITAPLTYSASEDFLLGLQGLPHVTVAGQRSGGGGGRPRTIRITNDMNLTVSTALTFDRNGTCIENHGVPVDITCAVFAADGRNVALERGIG